MRRFTALFFLAGCSPSANEAPPQQDASSVVDVADAAPPACSSEQATPDQTCGMLSWQTSPMLSRKRNHHTTYAVPTTGGAGFLVVAGGIDVSTAVANVDIAPIAPDGSIGAFAPGPPLFHEIAGATGTSIGRTVIVAGGQWYGSFLDTVYTANLADDGTLPAWKEQAKLPHPRMHAASFAKDGAMYVLAGFAGGQIWDDVVRGQVAADGTIASWDSMGTLPKQRSHFSVVEVEGYVFIAGGLDQPPTTSPALLKDVLRARIADDGSLVEWTPQPDMPRGLATHAAFFYGGYVYQVGGIDDAAQSKRVLRSPVTAHALGAWEEVAPLPIARGHVHQVPLFNDRFYSVAGAIDFNLSSTDAIFIGSFAP